MLTIWCRLKMLWNHAHLGEILWTVDPACHFPLIMQWLVEQPHIKQESTASLIVKKETAHIECPKMCVCVCVDARQSPVIHHNGKD